MKLVAFTVAGETYSVPVESVAEVIRAHGIKKVPNTPGYIEGVVYWRQRPLPVINLRTKFGENEKEPGNSDRIVIVNSGGRMTGLLVDSVIDLITVDSAKISSPDPLLRAAEYLLGIYSSESGAVLIADPSRILSASENTILEAAL